MYPRMRFVRAAKALRAVHNVCLQFEEETCSSTRSAHLHRVPSFGEDFESLLTLLIDKMFLNLSKTDTIHHLHSEKDYCSTSQGKNY